MIVIRIGWELQTLLSNAFKNSTTSEKKMIIIPYTLTPPPKCNEENYIWLIESFPMEVTFGASSFAGPAFSPGEAKLQRLESTGSWRPAANDDEPWIEIRFSRPKPVYGVIVKGDIAEDMYVTSYKLLFSENGQAFSYLKEPGSSCSIVRNL
jgi:hypothetical protein